MLQRRPSEKYPFSAVNLEIVWWSVAGICWFQSHALYCPSVIYPPDIHSLINVLSDLLNLFSFLLTVILFPLDRPDTVRLSVCTCTCECVCSFFLVFLKLHHPKDKTYLFLFENFFFHQFIIRTGKKENTVKAKEFKALLKATGPPSSVCLLQSVKG